VLEQLIEKWRGIDRWQVTDATVVSYEVISEGGYKKGPPSARITFFYHDGTHSIQSGELVADSLTSLYNLEVKDTFQIRFNPQRPSKFYCSESTSLFTEFRLVFWVCLGVLVAMITLMMLFQRR
jgi:hypothetical protein